MTEQQPVPTEPDAIAEAREDARTRIRTGFWRFDDMLENVLDRLEDEAEDGMPEGFPGLAETMVREEWELRLAEQAAWTDEGDFARLASAFAELESDGFVARMNFTCCQTCGHAEIGDELGEGAAADAKSSYVFFHQQDAERLAEPGGRLYFAFGSFRAPDARWAFTKRAREVAAAKAQRRVGERIVEALGRQGFETSWDGTTSTRPAVMINDWRKSLPV